jgi:hypothetical protein
MDLAFRQPRPDQCSVYLVLHLAAEYVLSVVLSTLLTACRRALLAIVRGKAVRRGMD